MKDIQIFKNEQFGEVRITMSESDEPLFCAKDVATSLGFLIHLMLFQDIVNQAKSCITNMLMVLEALI